VNHGFDSAPISIELSTSDAMFYLNGGKLSIVRDVKLEPRDGRSVFHIFHICFGDLVQFRLSLELCRLHRSLLRCAETWPRVSTLEQPPNHLLGNWGCHLGQLCLNKFPDARTRTPHHMLYFPRERISTPRCARSSSHCYSLVRPPMMA
jgi:hypothetical protein